MLSSGRGPGVIGMLMALLVLVGFGALYVFVFDEGMQGGNRSLQSIVAEQEKEIGTYQASLRGAEERLSVLPAREKEATELAVLKQERVFRSGTIDGLSKNLVSIRDDLAGLGQSFEEYKDRYRDFVRKEAAGTEMAELLTANGDAYKNVTIREVDAAGISIRHDGGIKRIPFEALSEEMKDHFQFDPEQKAEAVAAENERRAELDRAVAEAHAEMDRQLAEQRKIQAAKDRENALKSVALKQDQILKIRGDIRKLEREKAAAARQKAAARAAGRSFIDKSNNIDHQIRQLHGAIRRLEQEVQALRSQT